jgi:hypothetical protein
MKLAIAGKGGSGKTSISGTMARQLARDGHRVLAIDGDTKVGGQWTSLRSPRFDAVFERFWAGRAPVLREAGAEQGKSDPRVPGRSTGETRSRDRRLRWLGPRRLAPAGP